MKRSADFPCSHEPSETKVKSEPTELKENHHQIQLSGEQQDVVDHIVAQENTMVIAKAG